MKFWASLFLLNDEKSHKRSKTKLLFALKSIMWTKNLNVRYSALGWVRGKFESRFFRHKFLNNSEKNLY